MSNFAMFRALLAQQWKLQRVDLTLLTIAAAVISPVYIWGAQSVEPANVPYALMNDAGQIGVLAGGISVLLGALLAFRPFVTDGRSGHTYALSLPLARQRYAGLRILGGLTLVSLPASGLLIGALVAISDAPPSNLHSHPLGLTLRFALASAFAFSLGFAIQYGLGRRALRWVLLTVITVAAAEIVGTLVFRVSLVGPFLELMRAQGSPLRIFVDHWQLYDV